MSLTFYFAPMSTASLTEAVIAELGIDCERVQLELGEAGTQSATFRDINPNGRVPTIVHDGTVIWESAAITLYLGEVFGVDAGLFPVLGPLRGEAMKWVVWSNVVMAEAAGRLSQVSSGDGAVEEGSQDVADDSARTEAAAKRARADVAKCLVILDAALADRDFLVGDYSLVDTHVHCLPLWMTMMGVDLSAYPNVAEWLKHCSARPALASLTDG